MNLVFHRDDPLSLAEKIRTNGNANPREFFGIEGGGSRGKRESNSAFASVSALMKRARLAPLRANEECNILDILSYAHFSGSGAAAMEEGGLSAAAGRAIVAECHYSRRGTRNFRNKERRGSGDGDGVDDETCIRSASTCTECTHFANAPR